jgi:FkbM family methyltransferase
MRKQQTATPLASEVRTNRLVERLIWSLRDTRLARRISLSLSVRYRGRSIRVPVIDGLGLGNSRLTEPWMLPLLERLLALDARAVLDVGVNLGQTLMKFLLLSDGRRYIGCEPNPLCVFYVERMAALNDARSVAIIPCGLSDQHGVLQLFSGGPVDSAASLVAGFRDASEYTSSRIAIVAPGDEVLQAAGAPPIGILKIDVEGAELDVLRGLHQTLARDRPLVVCEILPTYSDTTENGRMRRKRADAVTEIMTSLGYRMYRINHAGGLQPLDRVETHGDVELSDYLFAPRERSGDVERAFGVDASH